MHYLEAELKASVRGNDEIFTFLQRAVLDGIWYWDIEKPQNEWYSPEFCRLLGYAPEEVPHNSGWWQDKIFPEDLDLALANFHRHLDDPNYPYDQVVRYRHKDGSTIWVRCRGMAMRNEAGKPLRLLGSHIDLTELHKAQEKLERLTLTDPLTELLNRRGLEDILHRWMARADREDRKVYAAILDLDDFKAVNDTYGHDRGDALLKTIASRVRDTLRPYDAAGRIGGDEFCLIYLCEHRYQASKSLDRIQQRLAEGFQLGSVTLQVSFSAALVRVYEPAIQSILTSGVGSLKSAKENGKSQYIQTPSVAPPDTKPSWLPQH